ncbi:DEAD/DEAH box helicase family protein [Carboxydocella sp. ULO1]|uniref:DEAD/DEAH box helicase family protein n=1 Tax=Carboxydocella sp. ULO1 TaxID=1926599 RepID=UPI0009AEF62E|nr:DEAD/DEAH box helicase family protein [Carboxydocella sp. ULO1]GAW28756.1 DNA repair protein [Carboxydocella sp. ULO1]
MGFRDLNLKIKYRSSDDNIVRDFYIPVLQRSVVYKRAVGFFSSSSLIEISKGLSGLIKNGGKILLIASPRIQVEDIEAIKKGYEIRKLIEEILCDSILPPKTYFEEERLNLLAHLIATRRLDIKIAYMEENNYLGMYHEKIGIAIDEYGNKIAFTGSLNETLYAFNQNFESIDVFLSWRSEFELERVLEKEKDFDNLWCNNTKKIKVIDFPRVAAEKLQKFMKDNVNYDIDELEFNLSLKENKSIYTVNQINVPQDIKLYDYQVEAINNWESYGFRGIFDMATGTGKTITGLAAIVRLLEKVKRTAIFIICPYQHLVDQWVEEVKKFNFKPIIGYSASEQKDWKIRLRNAVIDYNLKIIDQFCFVTTNVTFSSDFVQHMINKISGNILVVIDEAHNFGALKLSKCLDNRFDYRLALSATIERAYDPEGTKKLLDFFGNKCIVYDLERAIKEKKLTPYKYYPVLTFLTPEELNEYKLISRQIAKYTINEDDGKIKLTDKGKKLAILRARLVAGSINKLETLKEAIKPYCKESHILVYCGATTIKDYGYKYGKADDTELRQIEAVADILGNQLGMKVRQFTSAETASEREIIKKEFEKGENLQALIAIRCLDEGVNIPKIKTAFLLASSTNPKEYIQRRGRVLRLAEGKDYATIFDFVTLPRPLDVVISLTEEEIKYDLSLIKKEINRIYDFSHISANPHVGYEVIEKIKTAYGILNDGRSDDYNEY